MLNNALSKATTVAIGGHVRPDGDCVGSCMALYQYVKNNFSNVQVDVFLEDIPDSLKLFDITKEIKHSVQEKKIYDLFIALDCGDVKRLGFSGCLFENALETLCIDHHISNQSFADNNYIIPDASSTSELVYRLMDKELIDTEIAECLYLGIVHDTGVFQYSCTSPETMEAAADLMRRNIRANEIKTSFAHSRPNGKSYSSVINITHRYSGENIAAGQTNTKQVFDAWMNSPGHRANILSPNYTQMGISLEIDSSARYKYYWAQLFIS